MDTHIGQKVGNYHIIRLLGHRGFADVYLGQNQHVNMPVAIKILRKGLDREHASKFIKEAQALADLQHPPIVHVRDCGIGEDQLPYEWISGEPPFKGTAH
jgi:serine/threonine-protein kinase